MAFFCRRCIGISVFVLVLLAIVVIRFNERANPTPSQLTHNGPIEIAWTVIPALILVVIAVPSFRLLTQQLVIPAPDMTLKVTASQWHWNYSYPKGDGGFSFDSLIKEDKDLKPGDIRLLSVDNAAYVPVGKVVELDVVSQDVIHSFSIPSFGVKIDAVPGRLNKSWFKADQEGVFYGQCSNICGIDHAFMPVEIHVAQPERLPSLACDRPEDLLSRRRRRPRPGAADPELRGGVTPSPPQHSEPTL